MSKPLDLHRIAEIGDNGLRILEILGEAEVSGAAL
jgi:hypothetical protein